MPNNERNDRNKETRESQNRNEPKPQTRNPGPTPNKAEGDEQTIEEALRNAE